MRRGVLIAGGGRQQRSSRLWSCNPSGRRSGSGGDVRVASPSFPSILLPFPSTLVPSLSLLYNSVFLPSSTLRSHPHFSLPLPPPLPSPQDSGRSPAEPSTRRASAAVCRALTSFCGSERTVAAACAAPCCTNARLAAPWTASAPAWRRPRGAAPAPQSFGPLIRPPENRDPRHPGSSSPEVSLVRPLASRHRRWRLARAPRAPGRRSACGDPGEAQAGLRTPGARIWSAGAETVLSAPMMTARTPKVRPGPGLGWTEGCRVPGNAGKYTERRWTRVCASRHNPPPTPAPPTHARPTLSSSHL